MRFEMIPQVILPQIPFPTVLALVWSMSGMDLLVPVEAHPLTEPVSTLRALELLFVS